MWLRTDNPPSTAISSERVHIDFTFHDGFLYDIQVGKGYDLASIP